MQETRGRSRPTADVQQPGLREAPPCLDGARGKFLHGETSTFSTSVTWVVSMKEKQSVNGI